MSVNISSIKVIKSKSFALTEEAFTRFMEEFEEDLPEGMFEEYEGFSSYLQKGEIPWTSEGSGSSFYLLRDSLLPLFTGSADLVLVWAYSGISGLRVVDGKVTRHEVIHSLGEEILSHP